MTNSLLLEIVTPEKIKFSSKVGIVLAPGEEGYLGILPSHAPLLAALREGDLWTRRDQKEIHLAIGAGFIQVTPEKVIVLSEWAERGEDLDSAVLESALRVHEENLRKCTSDDQRKELEMIIQRTLLKIRVSKQA
ncbi:MAG: ATP synthase F1 subunit epsilon [Armatimonadetes bacterium]|nr:ATP synthase F1 subunit epsilon [Armatimonadota bacterium]